jgi:ethanolamine ammonia-lyase small subunit
MLPEDDKLAQPDSPETDLSEILKKVRAQTPARLLAGRSGAAYRTNTQLELREAHAAARDAVRAELNLFTNFGQDFVRKWNLFDICSQAELHHGTRFANRDRRRPLRDRRRPANPSTIAAPL